MWFFYKSGMNHTVRFGGIGIVLGFPRAGGKGGKGGRVGRDEYAHA